MLDAASPSRVLRQRQFRYNPVMQGCRGNMDIILLPHALGCFFQRQRLFYHQIHSGTAHTIGKPARRKGKVIHGE